MIPDMAPRSLVRALTLLDTLVARPGGLGFGEVGALLGTADASTARLLEALASTGHVQKDADDGTWRAGPAMAGLAGGELRIDRLRRLAAPFLEHLRARCANTALLIVDTGGHMLALDRRQHEDSLSLQEPGHLADNWRAPPWGWLFRSYDQLARLPGQRGEPSLAEIRRELQRLARHGWVVRRQADRRRLAAPVHDTQGTVVAALAIGGTPARLPDRHLRQHGAELVAAARSLSALLV